MDIKKSKHRLELLQKNAPIVYTKYMALLKNKENEKEQEEELFTKSNIEIKQEQAWEEVKSYSTKTNVSDTLPQDYGQTMPWEEEERI